MTEAERVEEIEAVIACLGDDAAQLCAENPEDERAANMVRAAELLQELHPDRLEDSARMKIAGGGPPSKEEANAYMAAGLFNPINQVYFRAGLIACREYMARFVEAQSPEIAGSIRANWWPKLGPDFGPPRLMDWNELADGSPDEGNFKMKEPISPTLEALPIALQFLQTPEPSDVSGGVRASDGWREAGLVCQACAGDAPGGKCRNPKCIGGPIVRELVPDGKTSDGVALPDGGQQ
jgi:hypothetical protein